MKLLIVDDERRARERLARLLAVFPDVSIAAEAENGLDALEAIDTHSPDAVFLDVQMPGLDGFEMLRELPAENRPLIVFATAYDQYALNAFEVSAVDYLMKPIEEARLEQSIVKLRQRLAKKEEQGIEKLLAHLTNATHVRRITGKRLQKYHVLAVEQIQAFIADDELVFALTSAGRFLISMTLRDLETRLDPAQFARVHKQTIVNMTKIVEIEPILKGGATARLEGGETIEISRRYAPLVRDKLGW